MAMKRGMLSAALRLFTVQGSWNYDRMIGVGLGETVAPLLRDLPGGRDGARYREALARASGYFNAHPYLAGVAAGALARAEHDDVPGERIERLRLALVGPLGSVGDRLVWAGTLPAAAGIGLALAATAPVGVGAAVFLALHNAVHVVLRWWGLGSGWRHGMGVARALAAPGLVVALRVVTPIAAFSLGVALPLVARWLTQGFDHSLLLGTAAVGLVALVLQLRLAPTLGALRIGLLAAGVAILGGLLWR
jgi:PTS system mannose-specific IID component